MRALLTGAGNMGRAIRSALEARGDQVVAMVGRGNRPAPDTLAPADVAFEFSHASALIDNVQYAVDAGARNVVIGTSGWADDPATRDELDRLAGDGRLRVVFGPT